YSIARGFHQTGCLRLLYTDTWCRMGRSLMRRGPSFMRALATRHSPEIPDSSVVSFTPGAIWREWRQRRSRTVEEQHMGYIRMGRWFAQRVSDRLRRIDLDPTRDAFLGFDTGCLETQMVLREHGIFSIVDQIDPARAHEQIVCEESER